MSRRTKTACEEFSEREKDTLAHFTHARSMRLVDCTDDRAGGTVVPIQFGKRVFLATAGHVIPEGHDFILVPKTGRGRHPLNPIARYVDAKSDVGLLEIPESAALVIDHFVSSGEFLTRLPTKRRLPVMLTGYPGEYIADLAPRVGVVSAFTFSSVTLPLATLPDFAWEREPNTSRDLFIDYCPEGPMRLLSLADAGSDPLETNRPPPDLYGVSGAGIWIVRYVQTPTGLRVPGPLLIGIQTNCVPGRCIRGTRINAWLKLVERNYPELHDQSRQAWAVRL